MDSNDQYELFRNLVRRVNIGDTLTRSASRMPEKIAVIDGEKRYSYRELNSEANQLAWSFSAYGLSRGDSVALMAGNCAEFLITYYACAKLGVICVPVNLGWKSPEISYVLKHSQAKAVVVESHLVPLLRESLDKSDQISLAVVTRGLVDEFEPGSDSRTWVSLEDFSSLSVSLEPEFFVDDRDPVSYLYTSGTTSAPKCVASSHLSVYLESMTVDVEMGLKASDKSVALMPLFHTAQLNGIVTPLLILGASIILLRGFNPDILLDVIEKEGATHIFCLPMMYRALLARDDIEKRNFSTLELATYAMAPMPDGDLKRAIEVFGCNFALAFGQTEMAPVTTVFKPEFQLDYAGSVGQAAVNTQVEIMDDYGRILPWGMSGEIVYRSPHALEGYARNEEATREVFAFGWFHSGDIGHFDHDGFLWFEDRKKDVIKTGGENVASIEVEKAIYDTVDGVQEVVVIGLPHSHWGEAITAIVTKRPGADLTEDDLLATLKEQLSGFKTPKAVIFLDEMPRTSTGKVQKHILREQLVDYYRQ